MVSYMYGSQNKSKSHPVNPANRWFFPNSVPSHGQLYVQNPKQNKSYPGNPIRLDGFQNKNNMRVPGQSHALRTF